MLIYYIAIALALFSGGVSTYGLMALAPGAAAVVAAMGLLFEAGKIAAFSLLHKPLPHALKAALLAVGLVLACINVAGVSAFLSARYEHELTANAAASHESEATARAKVELLNRRLAAAEQRVDETAAGLAHAKGDRDQIRAINAAIVDARVERDKLANELTAATAAQAHAEANTITSSAEFAAVAFIASATGTSPDNVAHVFIIALSAIPDTLAILLILAAGYVGRSNQRPITVKAADPTKPAKPKPLSNRQRAAINRWSEHRKRQAVLETAGVLPAKKR